MGTTSCIIIKQKLSIIFFHHLHYCPIRKNNKSKQLWNIFIFKQELLWQQTFCLKIFLLKWESISWLAFCEIFSRLTVMQVTGRWLMLMMATEQGPHPQSQIDWRSTTLYWMKKEFRHEILELTKIYFHKNSQFSGETIES